MAYPSLTFAHLLDNATRAELEQFVSLLQGYLSVEHTEAGAHSGITADSVTVTGDVTADGDGTFGGDVTAQSADTISKCRIGEIQDLVSGGSLTSGLHLGGTKGWVVGLRLAGSPGTNTDYELRLFDLNHLVAGVSALRLFYYTANSWWTLGVETGGALALGEDVSGKRLSEVNTIVLTATTATTGTATASTKATAATFGLTGRTAPAQITSNQDNYAISSGAARVNLQSDAARDITGIVAGFDGQFLFLINLGGFSITLKHNSGSSSVGNQILGGGSTDVVLRSNGSVLLHYDATRAFWYVLGA